MIETQINRDEFDLLVLGAFERETTSVAWWGPYLIFTVLVDAFVEQALYFFKVTFLCGNKELILVRLCGSVSSGYGQSR